jgi:hypothetical protein
MLDLEIDDLIDTDEIKKGVLKIKPIKSLDTNGEDPNKLTIS